MLKSPAEGPRRLSVTVIDEDQLLTSNGTRKLVAPNLIDEEQLRSTSSTTALNLSHSNLAGLLNNIVPSNVSRHFKQDSENGVLKHLETCRKYLVSGNIRSRSSPISSIRDRNERLLSRPVSGSLDEESCDCFGRISADYRRKSFDVASMQGLRPESGLNKKLVSLVDAEQVKSTKTAPNRPDLHLVSMMDEQQVGKRRHSLPRPELTDLKTLKSALPVARAAQAFRKGVHDKEEKDGRLIEPLVVPKVNIVPSTPQVRPGTSSPVVNLNPHHSKHGDRWEDYMIPEVDRSNVSPSREIKKHKKRMRRQKTT